MDKISIVVAVYNAEKTLKKCVDSLIGQTLKNTEIILVNDCSKDNSSSICKQYESEYSNVIAIDNPYNVGVSATRNNGIEKAKGDYICFVDSDDYVEPDYLEQLLNNFKKYIQCQFVDLYITMRLIIANLLNILGAAEKKR